MADVVMADDGIAFDGRTAEAGPLGGAETAFVALAEALAARGHRVEARSQCRAPLTHKGVALVPRARRRLFWLHNPARYLKKPRNLWRLAWHRPTLVLCGPHHANSVPPWLPCGGRVIIPYGVLEQFRDTQAREPPPPRAVFTSNPLRGLDWLLDLWAVHIARALPEAELHVYAGPAVYGAG